MNRKIVSRVIIPILIIVELSFLFLTCMSYSNKDVNKSKETYKVNKKMFSMYVINESTGEYDEYTGDYWPTGDYKLNQTKTNCVDNKGNSVTNILNYENNKLTITSNKTVFCYLYFDLRTDISIKVSTDGDSGVLPSTTGYKSTLSCNDATYSWNQKYQRVEFSNVSSDDVSCNLDYTKNTEVYPTLKSVVEENATSEPYAIVVDDDATYTTLEESDYANITFSNTYSNTVSYPYTFVDGKWTAPVKFGSYINMKFSVVDEGYYRVCYEISPHGSASNYDYNLLHIYMKNITETSATTNYFDFRSDTSTVNTGCIKYEYLTPNDFVYVRKYTSSADDNVSFYLQKTENYEEVSVGKRYSGKTPDNYVWFNNKMWQIIGSVPTVVDSNGTKENLVKIILVGDNLDGYDSSTISTYEIKDYYKKMLKKVYWNTGKVPVSITNRSLKYYQLYDYEMKSYDIQGYIGALSPSDFVYMSSSVYQETTLYPGEVLNSNWFFGKNDTNITHINCEDSDSIMAINSTGTITCLYFSGTIKNPVVYLDSSVYVISGNGTIVDPYIIGM